jgi:REP-associated tyrosine transposase
MIFGYHVIITAYGFWLPNDPRGSWSEFVRKWELLRFGEATKVTTRWSRAGLPHDRQLRLAAKEALDYPPVSFTGEQARAVGEGFGAEAQRCGYTIWACAILPGHAHLVIARHHYKVEQIMLRLKAASTTRLLERGIHPFKQYGDPNSGRVPRCWAQRGWKVFLDSVEAIERAIGYVERNPGKDGKPRQRWTFETPFVGV